MAAQMEVMQTVCRRLISSSAFHRLQIRPNTSFPRHAVNQTPCLQVNQTPKRLLTCSRTCLTSKRKNQAQQSVPEDKTSSTDIDEDMSSAVKSVASSLPGDQSRTESDLLQRLRSHAKLTKEQSTPGQPYQHDKQSGSLSETISGMRVSKRREREHIQHPQDEMGEQRQFRRRQRNFREGSGIGERMKLFEGPGLDIFPKTVKPQMLILFQNRVLVCGVP
ncbi:hypothetical protein ScPMuIL_012756 [Solemya velum]